MQTIEVILSDSVAKFKFTIKLEPRLIESTTLEEMFSAVITLFLIRTPQAPYDPSELRVVIVQSDEMGKRKLPVLYVINSPYTAAVQLLNELLEGSERFKFETTKVV